MAPNKTRTEAPTGSVPLVSWEPLRGSADGLDPVAEALGGDPSWGSRQDDALAWQRAALDQYLQEEPRDFLAVATPGAGKTTFGLRIARELLDDRTVDKITVVAPTEHLKHQWADAAARVGIALDSRFTNAAGQTSSDFHGVVVTYAQVAAHPARHRRIACRMRTA